MACAVLVAGVISTPADEIPGLYNTGVDNGGTVLANGADELHYEILENGFIPKLLNPPNGAYVPNDATSKWIWENANGQPGGVVRTFRISFDLTGLDPTTAVISGRSTSDNNTLDILVNGASTGETTPFAGFGSWWDFSLSNTLLVAGKNTIDFKVNEGGAPGGFRAEFLVKTADPLSVGVPDGGSSATLALLSLGTLALLDRRTRRSA
jgi:hypothetical protein